MSNFIETCQKESDIVNSIKKASIAIAEQQIRVGTRKLRSSFSLEAQQDISAMYGEGEKMISMDGCMILRRCHKMTIIS